MNKGVLSELRDAIMASEQTGIFAGSVEDKVKDACVKYLRFHGYRIAVPKQFNKKITNTRALVEHFYTLLNSRKPDNYATSYNEIRDMSVAKKFVEARIQATGVSREYALNECGEIVKTIFEHYDEFNFKYEVSFAIFGQGNLRWITDKAIQIMNDKLRDKEKEDAEVLRQKALASYSEPAGFSDLEELLKQMEEDN